MCSSMSIEQLQKTSIWDFPPGTPMPLVSLPGSDFYCTYGGKVVRPDTVIEHPELVQTNYRLRGGALLSEDEDESPDEESSDGEEEQLDGEPRDPLLSKKTTIVEGRAVSVLDSRVKDKGVLLSMDGYLYRYRYNSTPMVDGGKVPADVYGCQHWKSGCPVKLWVHGSTAEYLMESIAPHDHGADPIDHVSRPNEPTRRTDGSSKAEDRQLQVLADGTGLSGYRKNGVTMMKR